MSNHDETIGILTEIYDFIFFKPKLFDLSNLLGHIIKNLIAFIFILSWYEKLKSFGSSSTSFIADPICKANLSKFQILFIATPV